MHKMDNESINRLFSAILALENKDECQSFFEDLCTIQELSSMAQRLEVAQLIYQGKSYAEVNKLTGASTTTICRVGKCVNYGSGGYKTAIERTEKKG